MIMILVYNARPFRESAAIDLSPSRTNGPGSGAVPEVREELRVLLRLAAPMILTQITQMGMGVMDTIMAGRVGAADLAGVALGGNFFWPSLMLLSGVLMSLTPTVSQLHGAGAERDAGEVARQAFWIALISRPSSNSLRALSFRVLTSYPSRKYVPRVRRSKQPRMFIMVLLPEPLGPMMAQKLPRLKDTVTSFRAWTSCLPI